MLPSTEDHSYRETMGSFSFLGLAVRVTNVIVAIFGLALITFGIYMIVEVKSAATVPIIILSLGTVNLLFGMIIATCGYQSIFFLRLYALVLGLLVII